MPRRPRLRIADVPFHVIQRGNNRNPCFFHARDYRRYLRELRRQAAQHGIAIHAYVLMTNHVHLLLTPRAPDGVGLMMKFLGQAYVQYVNRSYQRSGSLWEGRFRSCLVDRENYLLQCHRYIECNPVRAGMVRHAGAYRWSSYRANALGAPDPVVTPHQAVVALGATADERRAAYRGLFEQELGPEVIEEIREVTNGGFVLGSDAFRSAVGNRLGRPVGPQRRGPKPKSLKAE